MVPSFNVDLDIDIICGVVILFSKVSGSSVSIF